jgi:hypothetical protein
MSLAGTRGLIRISKNPQCELQTAMVLDRVREREFYEAVTGEEFPGEYGERVSARRRGTMFESNLHQDRARLLREALGPMFGLEPETMVVRNLADEVPENDASGRVKRLDATRAIFADMAAGRPVPHLLIQPQLRLVTGPGDGDFDHVAPDFMVLDPIAEMFVPGEEKSNILRDGVAAPADLDRARRQAAAQILALRSETAPFGLDGRLGNRAVLVFASPQGLHPSRPVEERYLDAEVYELERALRVATEVRERLQQRRRAGAIPLPMLADELTANYGEACIGMCIMAGRCKERAGERARVLGDAAADLLGPDADLARVSELLAGAAPESPEEAALAEQLLAAARTLAFAGATEGRIS